MLPHNSGAATKCSSLVLLIFHVPSLPLCSSIISGEHYSGIPAIRENSLATCTTPLPKDMLPNRFLRLWSSITLLSLSPQLPKDIIHHSGASVRLFPERQPTTTLATEMLLSSGRRRSLVLPCLAVVALAALAAAPRGADAYKNYTVGDDKGWYDGLTLPGVDYQAWADGIKNFSLGDFLIFNTDKNHSVVQTRNGTLYKSCDYNDSGPDDTVEWSAAAPEFSKDAITVAVPLLKEGRTYFFSGNYDGEQCENGQRFAIDVAHGQGLLPDLRPPVADAPAPSAGPADGAAVFDFSHPKNVTTPSASYDDGELSGDAASGTSRTPARIASLAVTLVTVLFAVYY